MLRILCFTFLMSALGGNAPAQVQIASGTYDVKNGPEADGFRPNLRATLVAPRVEGGVQLDGILEEDLWDSAARAGNFSETFPGDQTKPPIGIEARVAHGQRSTAMIPAGCVNSAASKGSQESDSTKGSSCCHPSSDRSRVR
ncbi:MAG TPA: hypothetical protein VMO47_00670 [Rhodothermales bacterium]|nr:hypothetical protein [Rhodothermales bacterium]